MSQSLNKTFSVGDTLVPLWAVLLDGNGETKRDIEGDTITFAMTLEQDSSEKVVPGSEAGTVSNKQSGTGVAVITGITAAFPPVITTSDAHGLSTGDVFWLSNILGMTELNDGWYEAGAVAATTIEVNHLAGGGVYGTQFSAWTSGGIVDTRGLVSYDFAAADVDTAGIYLAQFIRTSSSETETLPTGSVFRIEIVDTSRNV